MNGSFAFAKQEITPFACRVGAGNIEKDVICLSNEDFLMSISVGFCRYGCMIHDDKSERIIY